LKPISSASISIKEDSDRILMQQNGQTIAIANINDVMLAIEILSAFKHRFFMTKSCNYNFVYRNSDGSL
jgi:hypothetical protein